MAYYQVRKRFGQHFLRDQNIIERIITTFDPKPGEKIIEIGPGKGALTIPLLHQQHELDVVEVGQREMGGLGELGAHETRAFGKH